MNKRKVVRHNNISDVTAESRRRYERDLVPYEGIVVGLVNSLQYYQPMIRMAKVSGSHRGNVRSMGSCDRLSAE